MLKFIPFPGNWYPFCSKATSTSHSTKSLESNLVLEGDNAVRLTCPFNLPQHGNDLTDEFSKAIKSA